MNRLGRDWSERLAAEFGGVRRWTRAHRGQRWRGMELWMWMRSEYAVGSAHISSHHRGVSRVTRALEANISFLLVMLVGEYCE